MIGDEFGVTGSSSGGRDPNNGQNNNNGDEIVDSFARNEIENLKIQFENRVNKLTDEVRVLQDEQRNMIQSQNAETQALRILSQNFLEVSRENHRLKERVQELSSEVDRLKHKNRDQENTINTMKETEAQQHGHMIKYFSDLTYKIDQLEKQKKSLQDVNGRLKKTLEDAGLSFYKSE